MTDKQILKQMVSEMPYDLPTRLIPYITEALQIARTEGIRDGFEAAREILNPLRTKGMYKYPTINDYLNSKK